MSEARPGEGTVSFFRLEQYLEGRLNPAEAAETARIIEKNPLLKRFVEEQASVRSTISLSTFRRRLQAERSPSRVSPGAASIRKALTVFESAFERFFHPSLPRPVWAMLLILTLGTSLYWMGFNSRPPGKAEAGLRAKGDSRISALLNRKELDPAEVHFARAGDTLRFEYRSPSPLHVQIWFQDDGQTPKPYLSSENALSRWPSSLAPQAAPAQIVFDSSWTEEVIWIIGSEVPVDARTVEKALKKGKASSEFSAQRYRLRRDEG